MYEKYSRKKEKYINLPLQSIMSAEYDANDDDNDDDDNNDDADDDYADDDDDADDDYDDYDVVVMVMTQVTTDQPQYNFTSDTRVK